MSIEYEFDKNLQQYRYKDSGKFLSKEAMKALTNKAINQVEKDLSAITELLIDRQISVDTWKEQTRDGLRKLHTWQYYLGLGGEKQFTPSDRGTLNNKLKKEWGYLHNFANQINEGKLSEAQIRHRLNLYINNTDNTQDLAIYKGHSRNGYKWERRIRTKTESCNECLFYERLGWRTIGNLPTPGAECSCKANCGCYKEFSKSDYIPQDANSNLLLKQWGWLNLDPTHPRPTTQNTVPRFGSPAIGFGK